MRNNTFTSFSKFFAYSFLILFIIIPAGFVVFVSFMKADSFGNIKFVFTFDNFVKLSNPDYLKILFNSIKVAMITTILTLIIAYPLAIIISRIKKTWQHFLFLLIILPYWTNSLVRTYSFAVMLRSDGVINRLLMSFGLVNEPLQLLYTEGAVIAAMIYLLLPVMFLPIYSSVSKLDNNYIDAAKDLGANSKKVFVDIVIPLTLPGIVAGVVMVFAPSLGAFFIADLIGGKKIVLLGNIIHEQFSTTRNLPFGSALSLVMMLLSVVFIVAYYKISFPKKQKDFNYE